MINAWDQDILNFHKGFRTEIGVSDPTYLGWKLIFNFNPVERSLTDGLTHDALFAEPDKGLDSAQQYLRDNGYFAKADEINAFKKNLEYINRYAPYYFQAIQGIAGLWKIDKGKDFTPFRGKDKVLTIGCLESIDLRMTALADLYRKATFDELTMRQLLPENLRHFTCILQIAEMRSFHKIKDAALSTGSRDGANSNNPAVALNQNQQTSQLEFKLVDDLISIIEFQLGFCEFDFEDSSPADEIDWSEIQAAKQTFKIKVGKIREVNRYAKLGLVLMDAYGLNDNSDVTLNGMQGTNTQDTPIRTAGLGSAFSRQSPYSAIANSVNGSLANLTRQFENLLPNAVGGLQDRLQGAVLGGVMGNVYGDIRGQNIAQLVNGFTSAGDQIKTGGVGGNVYPALTVGPTLSKGGLGDVFNDSPPGKDPTDLGNVYTDPTKPSGPTLQ